VNPVVPLTLGGYQLDVELALDRPARERGLMGRPQLPVTKGLLLCYPHPHFIAIWMRNTGMPLSAAFLDEHRRVINTCDLEPFDEHHHHQPLRPAKYVLEVCRGWFRARQLTAGAQAEFELPPNMAIT
jgi:uncharacterized membrane protein (UPF0127 family)